MFDVGTLPPPEAGPRTRTGAWLEELGELDTTGWSDAERIDELTRLERLKSAAAAAQARITEAFDRSQRAAAPKLKETGEVSRSVGAQVALARHDSPARGNRHLGVATALVREMPHTLAALEAGILSEWRATLIVQATACLTRADRARVDAELARRGLAGLGDRRIRDLARSISDRLDPAAAVRRAAKAVGQRRVTTRPAPDTMMYLTALLPVVDGVTAYAALHRHARAQRAAGDPRSLGQLMADRLVTLLTGREQAGGEPVEVQLVMDQRTLLRGSSEPAWFPGYGPLPAPLARQIVRRADKVWLRRLFTHPSTGVLVGADAQRRLFTGRLRDLITWRDQTCRTPWCDAPIRHLDHIRRHAEGGPTTLANADGLCEACNLAREAPGWRADLIDAASHVIALRTPTGHAYEGGAPTAPGHDPPPDPETRLRRLLDDTG